MVNVRPIRTEADYEAALARVAELMDAREGTSEGEELDVLVDLVEVYEDKHFPMGYPDPIAAIEFCMEQQGLAPRDLVPYIGSRARVSEVLSGKRAITMSMARALHEHLGIPAGVLLQNPAPADDASLTGLDADRFPLKEMVKRGWIPDVPDLKGRASELVAGLLGRAGGTDALEAVPMYRKNDHQRINAKTDLYALRAWCWHVLASANDDPPSRSVQAWDCHSRLPWRSRAAEPVGRRPGAGAGLPSRPRDRPEGGAPPPEDAPGRRRLSAPGEAVGHRSHPALRSHRQLLVLPPARAGARRPPL